MAKPEGEVICAYPPSKQSELFYTDLGKQAPQGRKGRTFLPPAQGAPRIYVGTFLAEALAMRTESQDYKGFEIQVAHNPPMWQVSIFYPKSPRVFPVNRAVQRISCQIKGDAFAKARERIDEVLKAVALTIPVAFGP